MNRSNLKSHIRAKVADIRDKNCPLEDKILVDTNVLLHICYPRVSQDLVQEGKPILLNSEIYDGFYQRLLYSNIELYVHPIVIEEYINKIEKIELINLHHSEECGSEEENLSFKDIRYMYPDKYHPIQKRIPTYVKLMKDKFNLITCTNNIDIFLSEFFEIWQESLAEASDAWIVTEAILGGIRAFLSDDIDFATFGNIKLYTANNKIIRLL